ncbi:long-chain-acyl-CoA synthetase [Pseudomonas sp. R5(2019)]|uniref:long-chain-acyl-CoA synthetase n=1 Tax=Pseudomonas sp. R5(2019) TaxID=2697566 RepID=UPI0014136102|nr:long-chain-acyl-CoA synthetase [Pseudomonas sp. R5(2019)]NBA93732.1 long-chain-acyl-CoA synthetase [Pseudomonas sp. R5(2019)]
MSDLGMTGQVPGVVSREHTQQLLDRRAQAASAIKPADLYTLADRLEARAAAFAERDLLVIGERRYSYAEVDREANRYAAVLRARGIGCGDVCALAMENRAAFFFAWFGLAKLGAVTAFINYHLAGKPLLHALQSTGAKAVIVGQECLQAFVQTPETASYPLWQVDDPQLTAPPSVCDFVDPTFSQQLSQAQPVPIDPVCRAGVRAEDTMLLIFTSGTTGLPKAARYSHMRWMSSGDVMQVTLDVSPDDVFYCCLPLYHGAAATSVTSTALTAGASIVVRRRFSVNAFWPDVRQHRISVFQYIGEICRYLLSREPQPDDRDHGLRCMLGAGLSPDIWQRWIERFGNLPIYEGWGSTEANANILNVDNRVGSCGRVPFWEKTNVRLIRFDTESQSHVRDEQGFYVQCEPGEVGEAIGFIIDHPQIGAGRFEGYTSREATESKILRNVFQPGDAYWSSGDLLRYDEDGYCYFVDRIGDTFRWKSENVSTQEVADALGDYPGLELINIYGVQVPQNEGRAGMAAVLMQPGQVFDPQTFFQLTQERVPRYAAPLFVRVCASADLTSTFKLRKVDLQRQGYDPRQFDDPLFVRDERSARYLPYSKEVLANNGLLPFAGDQ